jgi:hypothetical protein
MSILNQALSQRVKPHSIMKAGLTSYDRMDAHLSEKQHGGRARAIVAGIEARERHALEHLTLT